MNLYEVNCDRGSVYPEDQSEITFLVLAKDEFEAAKLCREDDRFEGMKRVYTYMRCEDIRYKDMPDEPCIIN